MVSLYSLGWIIQPFQLRIREVNVLAGKPLRTVSQSYSQLRDSKRAQARKAVISCPLYL